MPCYVSALIMYESDQNGLNLTDKTAGSGSQYFKYLDCVQDKRFIVKLPRIKISQNISPTEW